MTIETTDVRSSPKEQIVHAAEVIGRSEARRKVFEEIYRGKRSVKTVDEIALKTGLARIRVLQEALVLYKNRIMGRTKASGKLAYVKDDFYSQHIKKILRLAKNKRARENFPTKWTPRTSTVVINLPIPRKAIDAKQLTIDEIDSFEKVATVQLAPDVDNLPLLEKVFKKGLQKILGEQGEFTDWGGEGDDLFSTRMLLNGKRINVAFGLKGRGTKGKLTPKKMGKQGDQIQRLFRAPAEVFLVQYWNQIDESVLEQMKLFATAKSALDGKRIYYGVIDGQDTLRILQSYKESFEQDTQ
jgi:hypothetical protein